MFVVLSPVDNELTLPLVVFRLVDSDPTSVDSWVDSAPRVLLVVVRPVDRELTPLCAVLMPAAAEVDRLVTLLFVVFRPVDNELTPLCAVLIPAAAEVDRLVTLLFVLFSPVDNELTLPLVVFKLVDSDPTSVDS
ncbi:hypothetical protein WS88_22125 [Burkholderia cepacia]|nr:hypothetical protein WS88_22125 [Burkholderia cepacia]KVK96571.1 hypothetical protein WS93_23010 [Burkholderia cepacia]